MHVPIDVKAGYYVDKMLTPPPTPCWCSVSACVHGFLFSLHRLKVCRLGNSRPCTFDLSCARFQEAYELNSPAILSIDPTYKEEAVMGGRMTATINSNGDVCAIQKAGGEGVMSSVIMQCLRIASVKAADITSKINKQVDLYTSARPFQKVKRLPASVPKNINIPDVTMKESTHGALETATMKTANDVQQISKGGGDHQNIKMNSSLTGDRIVKHKQTSTFTGGPSNWDPYSKGVSLSSLRISPDPPSVVKDNKHEVVEPMLTESNPEVKSASNSGTAGESDEAQESRSPKSLKDAVKPKHKRKKKHYDKS